MIPFTIQCVYKRDKEKEPDPKSSNPPVYNNKTSRGCPGVWLMKFKSEVSSQLLTEVYLKPFCFE